MKITIINGSPRKNGATGKILKAFKTHLAGKTDVEIHYIDLVDYQLQNCSGCENCYKTGTCHIKDRAEEINQAVAQSQGIIIGSPTYVSNVSGLLKTYIDRGHIVVEQSMKGKYTMAVTTYEITGGSSVIGILNKIFRYAGGNPVGSFSLKLHHNSNPFEQVKVLKRIQKKADGFYHVIQKNKKRGLINRFINFLALHVVMKPAVVRYPKRYEAVLKRWREININA